MLAIRLQRVGRTGHAMYRVAVQESWRTPTSGRVIAYVGSYDPHTKDAKIQVEVAQKYLDNGAQPTPRVVKLLKDAGVKLPSWVEKTEKKTKTIRNPEKLRKNQPAEEVPVEVAEEAVETPTEEVINEPEQTPEEVKAEEVSESNEDVKK